MNDQIINSGLLENDEPEYSSLSKLAKFNSIIYFISAVSLFIASFIPFFMKRVEGYDSHLVSGAMFGSIQLLYFVLINIAALIVFLLGNSLINFSRTVEDTELSDPAIKALSRFFVILGVFSAASCIAGFIAVLNFIA